MSEEPHQGHPTGTLSLRHYPSVPWPLVLLDLAVIGSPHCPNAFATDTFEMK